MDKRCLGCMEYYGDDLSVCPHCGYEVGTGVEEAIHLNPGTFLANRYIVGRVLGYGGFGVTYIGWDGKLEQKVAIKEYLPSEFSTRMPGITTVMVFGGDKEQQYADGLEKFVEEAKRLSKFQNEPGIVKVFDAFKENGTAYIVMELLEGETLTERLKREGAIPENEAVEMLLPLMKSLEVVHGEGILHRDIAPDNIFITDSGEVKLIDFGASRYATTSHSRSLTVIVKPGYSPEEQYRSRGDQGPHSDVYALAATLYKMITGKTPPDAMERRAKVESTNKDPLQRPVKYCKDISDVREVALMNALNVQIEDRTPDIPTFLEELTADTPATRRGSALKRVDFYAWPLWFKVAAGVLGAAILALVALLLTGVLSWSPFSNASIVPEGYVEVPAVEEMDKDEAVELIEEAGLVASAEGNVESEYQPAGIIVLQSPNGGTFLPAGSTVKLTVSSGTSVDGPKDGVATVPYVIWDTRETAIAKLLQAGLGTPSVIEAYSTSVAAGKVMAQSEPYGTQLPEGTSITITISKGSSGSSNSGNGKKHTISGWVSEGSVPSGATIIATKYTYTLTETATSTSSSMSGWTRYDVQRTGWGPEKTSYTDPSNGTRNVWTTEEQYATSYTHHWCYYHRYSNNQFLTDGAAPDAPRHTLDLDYQLTAYGGGAYVGVSHDGQSNALWYPDGEYDDPVYSTRTLYHYQEPVYTYYYRRTSQQESSSYPSGDGVSNVQKLVQYEQWT